MLRKGEASSDEVVKYYKYQAQSHIGNSIEMAKHDQDLGEVYYFGARNIERNAVIAAKHFRVAAESGNARAMGMLGHLYARGHGVQVDAMRAHALYRAAAAEGGGSKTLKGNARLAHVGMGLYSMFGAPATAADQGVLVDDDALYYDKSGTQQRLKTVDYYAARHHLQKAANGGDASALYMLGKMRMLGLLVRPDVKKAYALFTQSARGGNPLAKRMMAKMSFVGVGTTRSCTTAIKYLKEVVESDEERTSEMERAHAHYKSGNLKMALTLYTRMATLGYSRAQANAAWILEQELHRTLSSRRGGGVGARMLNDLKRATTNMMLSTLELFLPNTFVETYFGRREEGAEEWKKSGGKNSATSSSSSKRSVWCGSHAAASCDACPQDVGAPSSTTKNHGSAWCHGDCVWRAASEEMEEDKEEESGSGSGERRQQENKNKNNGQCVLASGGDSQGRFSREPSLSDVHGERALYLYSQAASQGHDFALLKMGDLVFYGFAGMRFTITPDDDDDNQDRNKDHEATMSTTTYTLKPDYQRAKSLYQRATSAQQSAHVQSKAKFALGWMHEIGYPEAGVPRDIHLAKRLYDDASALSRDANAPVRLALARMRVTEAVRVVSESEILQWLLRSINRVRKLLGKDPLFGEDERTEEERKKIIKKKKKKEEERKKKEELINEKNKLREAVDKKGQTVRAGSMIKARWRSGRTFYTGYLTKVFPDGTMNIQYDDGDIEKKVLSHLVERVTERPHPIYLRKEENERATRRLASVKNGGSLLGGSAAASAGGGGGWFTSSWIVRVLVVNMNWDIVGLLSVVFLSFVFVLWSLRQCCTSPLLFWVALGLLSAWGLESLLLS